MGKEWEKRSRHTFSTKLLEEYFSNSSIKQSSDQAERSFRRRNESLELKNFQKGFGSVSVVVSLGNRLDHGKFKKNIFAHKGTVGGEARGSDSQQLYLGF